MCLYVSGFRGKQSNLSRKVFIPAVSLNIPQHSTEILWPCLWTHTRGRGREEGETAEGRFYVCFKYWLLVGKKCWEWGPLSNNRLKVITAIKILLKVKTGFNSASERFSNRKDVLQLR